MNIRILVPLDGSAFAEAAIGAAITLAERSRGRICFLTVEGRAEDDPYRVLTPLVHHEGAQRYLDDVRTRFQPVTSVPISTAVRHGSAAAEIVHEATTSHDLIVMSSHGRGGVARMWFGSVTDECVRTSVRPVLVVRPFESAPASLRLEVSEIVVPLDGSQLAESILPAAARFAKLLRARIRLVRVVEPPLTNPAGYFPPDGIFVDPKLMLDEANAYLSRVAATQLAEVEPPPTVQVMLAPRIGRTICDAAGPNGLVAMATHGWGGIRRALLGSVSDAVVRGAQSAVLLIRPEATAWSYLVDRTQPRSRSPEAPTPC